MNVIETIVQPLVIFVLGARAVAYMLAPIVQRWQRHRTEGD